MTNRLKTHLLLALLALCTALAMAAGVQAQDRRDQGSQDRRAQGGDAVSVTFDVNFGTAPHWVGVRGTRITEIREGERPGYDMFRCGRYYYVYDNDRWYRSRRWRGRFTWIENRSVPGELRRVPREHWRHYPAAWQNPNGTPPGLEKKGGIPPGLEKKGQKPHSEGKGQGDARDRGDQPTEDRGHR